MSRLSWGWQNFFFKYLFLIFGCPGSSCCEDVSLISKNGGYSLVAMHWLLIAVASLVAEHRLYSTQASIVMALRLQSTGSIVVVHELSCSEACGIVLDQGLNPCLLHWQADPLPPSHQEGPRRIFHCSTWTL